MYRGIYQLIGSYCTATMPEDRKKILEALAAKRKAEAESGEKKKRQKVPLNPAKPASKPVSKPAGGIGSKGKAISAPISATKTKTKSKHKEEVKPKRVSKMDRYETDEDEESEEEDDFDSESDDDELSDEDSEDDIKSKAVKKLPPQSKGKTPVKGISSSNGKGRDEKGKGIMKDKGKAKAKLEESSSDAEGDSDDDGGDLSDDPLQEVDPSNILPSKTRRRASQPGNYQFANISGDDDDDDDDDDSD